MNMIEDQHGTLFIKELTNLDCAVFDPATGVNGQSWHVDVQVSGALDSLGFVYDFSKLKKLARHVLKDTIDHALIMPVSSQRVDFSEDGTSEHWSMHAKCRMTDTDHVWKYQCPKGAVYPIRCAAITTEILEHELSRVLRHRLPESVNEVGIKLRNEESEETAAFFRYSHGISHHDGLCQRMFHGHRSRVEAYVDGERRADLEHMVCRDILGASVHVASTKQLKKGRIEPGCRGIPGESVTIGFEAQSGYFEATIPADRVFLVEEETSIECISKQLAHSLRARWEAPAAELKLTAYEGIRKGASTTLEL